MPVYEYLCESCGRRFDELQRMADDPLTECKFCQGSVRRVIQPVGIIFKGSGFYATDSRKSSSSTVTSNDKTESGGTSEAKSDTKSDTKSDSSSSESSSAPAAPSTESKPAATTATSSD